MNNFLFGVLASSSIIIIYLLSKVLLEIKRLSKVIWSSTTPRERKILKALNTIEKNLFDGGGKKKNILEDQKFQDELLKDFIKENLGTYGVWPEDHIPQSGNIPYGHTHNVSRNNQGASKDWNWKTDRKTW